MERKACRNCRHNSLALDFASLGTSQGGECRCTAPTFPRHLYRRYRDDGELLAILCGHYEAQNAGPCAQCGANLGPVHLVEHWATGVFTVAPCCSPACLAAQQACFDAERDAMVPEPAGDRYGVGRRTH